MFGSTAELMEPSCNGKQTKLVSALRITSPARGNRPTARNPTESFRLRCSRQPSGEPCSALLKLPADDQLPYVQRGKPSEVPLVRLLRRASRRRALGAAGARGAAYRDHHLLRPQGIDRPRRAPRPRGDARGEGALLHHHGRRNHEARRQDREVHRRRDHGGLRAAAAARRRRPARGASRGRHAGGAARPQRRPVGSATAFRSRTARASTPARSSPTTTRPRTRSWPPATPSTSPRGSSRRRRRTRSTSARRRIGWCATRSRSKASSRSS